MTDQKLRDRNGRLLGIIKTLRDGKIELRDPTNRLKGIYDPKRNETRDHIGRLVGKGNLLTTLL
jgi:hypothetical protein